VTVARVRVDAGAPGFAAGAMRIRPDAAIRCAGHDNGRGKLDSDPDFCSRSNGTLILTSCK
jgi:hypothetical protein